MTTQALQIGFIEQAHRIYLFDEVYPLSAAKEQAEKKKLAAFGMLAKFNPLNRPREDTVMLTRHELRLEPFWHIVAQRQVDYEARVTYPVPVHNPHALGVSLAGQRFDVARQSEKTARIDVEAVEHCHRKLDFDAYLDGLERDLRAKMLEGYCAKYKFSEVQQLDRPEIVKPLLAEQAAIQKARSALLGHAINAHEINQDHIVFEKVYLYLRPVFAFEFVWSSADKVGVIEVNGLTGEVNEDGRWFKEKLDKILTRDMLIEASSELAGAYVPGGGLADKLIGRVTE